MNSPLTAAEVTANVAPELGDAFSLYRQDGHRESTSFRLVDKQLNRHE